MGVYLLINIPGMIFCNHMLVPRGILLILYGDAFFVILQLPDPDCV